MVGYIIYVRTNQGDLMTITNSGTNMSDTKTSYANIFANQILSDFYSPDRHSDSAMDCADKFRDDEWRVTDNASYADNTRNDLHELGAGNEELSFFIADVIDCMRYNHSMVMD